ncbi:hypothetical protein V6N13_013158 [Hibiscus sabdariffa]|uniref:Uncharacterized protein n=1 Tax=Hibiscus sabdariffa TaxID=183260 RepID=A0ABR2SI15_9ROSI
MEGTSEVDLIQLAQQTIAHVFSCEIYDENHSYEDFPQHAEKTSYVSNMKSNTMGNSYNTANRKSWNFQFCTKFRSIPL